MIESVDSDSSDDKSITLMGILNTLETICSVLMEEKEVRISMLLFHFRILLSTDCVHCFFNSGSY